MANPLPRHVKTISEYHQLMGLPKPEHPLISVVSFDLYKKKHHGESGSWRFDFYTIAVKRNFKGKIKYGQQQYDFDEGIMTFMSPGQVLSIVIDDNEVYNHSGWLLLLHPDFLWHTPLAQRIKHYQYFDYAVHEALFLSEQEEIIITGTLQQIKKEYNANIDAFTQNIIIAQLEVLLNYAERFYNRQFITRKISHHQLLTRMEDLLNQYFEGDDVIRNGLPSVKLLSDSLNVSQNYLSVLLKTLTGQSTQQHIQDKVIEKAKQQLSTTGLSVNEIAYNLGYSYPQSFNKLFKSKTNMSPMKFRTAFN